MLYLSSYIRQFLAFPCCQVILFWNGKDVILFNYLLTAEKSQDLIMNKGGAQLLAKMVTKTDDPQTLRMVAGALANLCGNGEHEIKIPVPTTFNIRPFLNILIYLRQCMCSLYGISKSKDTLKKLCVGMLLAY